MIGTSLAQYEIQALLGEGGMGQVYRARDAKLGRGVAIKVLPEAFRADPDRAARFEREAKLLAALNHPNVAALYGLEEADGRRLLVMELVEGDTLTDRLVRGPLAIEETVRIALQIAEALEAAHEKGIVHRDLKPAKIKLTADDKVKVLDFGLAKAADLDSAISSVTRSPTLSLAATQAGVVLGTAAYMSPEQAKGLSADHRSDIFSFGVVLHEMLTGRQPFQGETAAEVMASVIVRESDLSAVPADCNPRLVELLKRCLEKNPKKRWQAIGDVRAELEAIAVSPRVSRMAAASTVGTPSLWRRVLIPAFTAVAGAAVAAVAIYSRIPTPPETIVTRFAFGLGEGQTFTNTGRQLVAMSPDGTKMVYVASQRLWLRPMSDLEARPIAGTVSATPAGITNPVFSPDGQSIVFYSLEDRALKRVPAAGGTAVTIAPASNPFGLSWNGGVLVFGQADAGIMRVPETGGTPETIVRAREGEAIHGPQLLPGGEWLLYTMTTATGVDRWEKSEAIVQRISSDERRTILGGATDARYLPTGHLVYTVRGAMFAVRFDLNRLQTAGGPVAVLEGIAQAVGGTNTPSAALVRLESRIAHVCPRVGGRTHQVRSRIPGSQGLRGAAESAHERL